MSGHARVFPFLAKDVAQGGLEWNFLVLPASRAGPEVPGTPEPVSWEWESKEGPTSPWGISLEQETFPETPSRFLAHLLARHGSCPAAQQSLVMGSGCPPCSGSVPGAEPGVEGGHGGNTGSVTKQNGEWVVGRRAGVCCSHGSPTALALESLLGKLQSHR